MRTVNWMMNKKKKKKRKTWHTLTARRRVLEEEKEKEEERWYCSLLCCWMLDAIQFWFLNRGRRRGGGENKVKGDVVYYTNEFGWRRWCITFSFSSSSSSSRIVDVHVQAISHHAAAVCGFDDILLNSDRYINDSIEWHDSIRHLRRISDTTTTASAHVPRYVITQVTSSMRPVSHSKYES